MKSLTNCENPSSNPLQGAFRKQIVTLLVFPKAACDYKNCSVSRSRMYTGEIQPMRVKESRKRNLMWLIRNNL
jgi:hypothetical protein